jgi:hypothetical protein
MFSVHFERTLATNVSGVVEEIFAERGVSRGGYHKGSEPRNGRLLLKDSSVISQLDGKSDAVLVRLFFCLFVLLF